MLALLGSPSNISASELPLILAGERELSARRGFLRDVELAPADFAAKFDGVRAAHQGKHVGDLPFLAGENGWRKAGVADAAIAAAGSEQSQTVHARIIRNARDLQIAGGSAVPSTGTPRRTCT